jgi:hypothetical protein
MASGTRKLRQRQEKVIVSLLEQGSIRAASEACGVPERTIRSWLLIPSFIEELARARRQILDVGLAQLSGLSTDAALVLAKLLKSEDEHVLARTSLGIMTLIIRGAELADSVSARRQQEAAENQQMTQEQQIACLAALLERLGLTVIETPKFPVTPPPPVEAEPPPEPEQEAGRNGTGSHRNEIEIIFDDP